jgi:hypothetical protein
LFAPHQHGRGFELKVQLVRAAIQGINAIRMVCPGARFINVDPMCRVVAPFDRPDLEREVRGFNGAVVYQSWDMLSGNLMPELGGSPAHLDIVGVNYYWTNQWEIHNPGVYIGSADPRHWPVRKLLRAISSRYDADILITETSHAGDMRAPWLREVAADAVACVDDGIPLRGVCLYPATSMPEWHAREQWTHMGIWDLLPHETSLERVAHEPMIAALHEVQRRLAGLQKAVPRLVS